MKKKTTTPNTKTLEFDALPVQSHAHISFFPLFHMKFLCITEECQKYDKFGTITFLQVVLSSISNPHLFNSWLSSGFEFEFDLVSLLLLIYHSSCGIRVLKIVNFIYIIDSSHGKIKLLKLLIVYHPQYNIIFKKWMMELVNNTWEIG